MAQQLITDQQVLGANPDYADIERKKKIAELLMGEATEQPKGQMISGRYVGSSPWQHIANLANIYVGKSMQEEADKLMQNEAVRQAYEHFQLICKLTQENQNGS